MTRLPALAAALLLAAPAAAEPFRLGIIGTDTSHVLQLAKNFNADKPAPAVAGFRIVAAYKGGSPDLDISRNRVEEYAKTLKDQYQIEIVDSIDTLLGKVDGVLLTSVDGRPHLAQARPVFKAGKPVFIDKPVAASLADTMEIFRLAAETKTPCFSSSGLRFGPETRGMRANPKLGGVLGCDTFGPVAQYLAGHPDLGYYGIHGIEMLFTVMGPGVKTVTRVQGKDADVAVGVWADGRVGTVRGQRGGKGTYGGWAFGPKATLPLGGFAGYEPLAAEVAAFFKTGVAPVPPEETLDIMAFIEAADESKKRGGAPVEVAEVYAAAKAKAAALSSGGK